MDKKITLAVFPIDEDGNIYSCGYESWEDFKQSRLMSIMQEKLLTVTPTVMGTISPKYKRTIKVLFKDINQIK